MKKFLNNATVKLIFIGILVLVLLIPAGMILSLVSERQSRQAEAIAEVSEKWSGAQTVAGPLLKIPYNVHWREKIYDQNGKFLREEPRAQTKYFFLLPENLKISGKVTPEIRLRGIYEVMLYRSKLDFSGTFAALDLKKNNLEGVEILWDKASVSVGLSDMRGIETNPSFVLNNKTVDFEPETQNSYFPVGIHAEVSSISQDAKANTFSFSLDLKGSGSLSFLPLGKNTVADIDSPWETPSFNGNFLPNSHSITETGFKAHWSIPHFERSFPQAWHAAEASDSMATQMYQSAFGAELIIPVDFYQKNERSVKYAALFIALTFLTFFLFEVLQRLRIHPFQYLLVGLAMCVFYLLLISFSEHLSFAFAYLLAGTATISLIGSYCLVVLKTRKNALLITGLLTGVYIYLYVLLQIQDYALLLGAIFVFLALGSLMYLTRKVDWYDLSLGLKED